MNTTALELNQLTLNSEEPSSTPNPSNSSNLDSAAQCLTPFQESFLRTKLDSDLPSLYRQRLQIMLMANEGKTQAEIARELGCSPLTVRHWTLFAKSGEAHNWQNDPIGRPAAINAQYIERLRELVNVTPRDIKVPGFHYTYPQRRWTAKLLGQHLQAEFGISVTPRHINRLLQKMGLSTRPQTKSKSTSPAKPELSDRIVIQDLSDQAANSSSSLLFPPL
jgi:transposase